MVVAHKKGKLPNASQKIKQIARGMSLNDAQHFAESVKQNKGSTKHMKLKDLLTQVNNNQALVVESSGIGYKNTYQGKRGVKYQISLLTYYDGVNMFVTIRPNWIEDQTQLQIIMDRTITVLQKNKTGVYQQVKNACERNSIIENLKFVKLRDNINGVQFQFKSLQGNIDKKILIDVYQSLKRYFNTIGL